MNEKEEMSRTGVFGWFVVIALVAMIAGFIVTASIARIVQVCSVGGYTSTVSSEHLRVSFDGGTTWVLVERRGDLDEQ